MTTNEKKRKHVLLRNARPTAKRNSLKQKPTVWPKSKKPVKKKPSNHVRLQNEPCLNFELVWNVKVLNPQMFKFL